MASLTGRVRHARHLARSLRRGIASASGDDGPTSFGYKTVPKSKKEGLVAEVFKNVAPSYDVMNDLMSGGLHRLWKDRLVGLLRPFPGMQHVDVAGGTGDVAFRILGAIREAEADVGSAAAVTPGCVAVCDINPAMVEVGKQRAEALGFETGLVWAVGNAEQLPFPDACMDAYTIAFGIRNVTNPMQALAEAHRVLRPGGRFLCLEFSQVNNAVLRQIYDAYSMSVIPGMGEVVAGDRESYQYLVESIRRFPDQETFRGMVADAGFQGARYEDLTAGVVAIHTGFKV